MQEEGAASFVDFVKVFVVDDSDCGRHAVLGSCVRRHDMAASVAETLSDFHCVCSRANIQ